MWPVCGLASGVLAATNRSRLDTVSMALPLSRIAGRLALGRGGPLRPLASISAGSPSKALQR